MATVSAPVVSVTLPRRRRARWVPLIMVGAMVSLLAGLWAGLILLGIAVPLGPQNLAGAHGVLMTLGFLGTLISLERAVAIGEGWAYAGPAASGLGAVAVLAGLPGSIGQSLLVVAGLVLVAAYVAVHRIQPSLHNVVMAAGALCWVAGASLWAFGWSVAQIVPWLAGFLVLTIAGERLELSRLVAVPRAGRWVFVTVAATVAVGLIISVGAASTGVRIAGAGLLGIAAWLARYDIARRTVRAGGLTRFMAVALLTGYGWLAIGGGLWLVVGQMAGGPAYDAMLHSVFLGFVMSMVFAHAPVIFPAVLGRSFPYRPVLYVPLALLHVSLLVRVVVGDALGGVAAVQWGGTVNEIAILLYGGLVVTSMLGNPRRRRDRVNA